jgi:hypothetical protein
MGNGQLRILRDCAYLRPSTGPIATSTRICGVTWIPRSSPQRPVDTVYAVLSSQFTPPQPTTTLESADDPWRLLRCAIAPAAGRPSSLQLELQIRLRPPSSLSPGRAIDRPYHPGTGLVTQVCRRETIASSRGPDRSAMISSRRGCARDQRGSGASSSPRCERRPALNHMSPPLENASISWLMPSRNSTFGLQLKADFAFVMSARTSEISFEREDVTDDTGFGRGNSELINSITSATLQDAPVPAL